ncbi:MAG TPA: helix-turn-helix domain-containing protein, partial [Candidatus Dormibacteraeota bacterium]|nr:helix-turn-helix domain-containing protein [Candidatus Dormibacteraeota bacterium]
MLLVPKSVPQQAIKNCGAAFQRFFRKQSGYPKFKKKGVRDSARLDNGPGTFLARRTFKYRLYPKRQQRHQLQATLDVCRELYNAGLQERREAWSSHRKAVGYLAQAQQLAEI